MPYIVVPRSCPQGVTINGRCFAPGVHEVADEQVADQVARIIAGQLRDRVVGTGPAFRKAQDTSKPFDPLGGKPDGDRTRLVKDKFFNGVK